MTRKNKIFRKQVVLLSKMKECLFSHGNGKVYKVAKMK